jgi:hypothetical protein
MEADLSRRILALQPALAHRIFALVPVDQRARCACVCRCVPTMLDLCDCAFAPASAPALARLLGGGTLTRLVLCMCRGLLDDPASAALLAAALQASTTLTSLRLDGMDMWSAHAPGAVLLDALVGHPRLQKLTCVNDQAENPETAAAAGAALGALVAADAPVLTELSISHCRLGDAALGPLVDALPRNKHLRSLHVDYVQLHQRGLCGAAAAARGARQCFTAAAARF